MGSCGWLSPGSFCKSTRMQTGGDRSAGKIKRSSTDANRMESSASDCLLTQGLCCPHEAVSAVLLRLLRAHSHAFRDFTDDLPTGRRRFLQAKEISASCLVRLKDNFAPVDQMPPVYNGWHSRRTREKALKISTYFSSHVASAPCCASDRASVRRLLRSWHGVFIRRGWEDRLRMNSEKKEK